MPVILTECNEHPLCHGFRWEIRDEQRLAEIVARLMLGHYRHVQRILTDADQAPPPNISDEMINELIIKLAEPANEGMRYQRDGWVFQMISWIAAVLAEPKLFTAIPHSQEAQKGFDNLIVSLERNGDNVAAVVICEDKATENSRKTIQEKVWPEIEDFETGRRDHELVNEVTAILERYRPGDVDKLIENIFWKGVRNYRVTITTNYPDNPDRRRRLFKGYDEKAPGNTNRRRAETIRINHLRAWMDGFCLRVIQYLGSLKCITQ